jgi:hypothetical protein
MRRAKLLPPEREEAAVAAAAAAVLPNPTDSAAPDRLNAEAEWPRVRWLAAVVGRVQGDSEEGVGEPDCPLFVAAAAAAAAFAAEARRACFSMCLRREDGEAWRGANSASGEATRGTLACESTKLPWP